MTCQFVLYIIIVRPERNVRASLMPPRWRSMTGGVAAMPGMGGMPGMGAAGGGGAGRGAAGGAVCAALVGAAPLPRPNDLTPSTDLSTLNDTERSWSDRQVQTEESSLYPRLRVDGRDENGGVQLDARRLAALAGGLPSFPTPRPASHHAPHNAPHHAPPAVSVLRPDAPL
ncbi:hypothetical protein evm_014491 [Chilo suppressalis]|nr:hypothetical protein evm_014491 [Chilo suppressalis]